jgi:hypothetical protein
MPLSPSFVVLVAITAFVAGLVVLVVGILLGWRDSMRRSDELFQDLIRGFRPELGAQSDALGALIATQDSQRRAEHAALRDSLDTMRADLEWLTGERMIEQAIQMCRDGQSTGDISRQTGLTHETVHTLNMLRAH